MSENVSYNDTMLHFLVPDTYQDPTSALVAMSKILFHSRYIWENIPSLEALIITPTPAITICTTGFLNSQTFRR